MTTTTTDRREHRVDMRDRLQMPRSRGATTGLLLVLLGIWGGLVPFVGPYFGYAFTPDLTWHFTWGRLWVEILPAAATFLGGLMLIGSANRVTGHLGAWLAAAGGAWFVIGQQVSRLWTGGLPAGGLPVSTSSLGYVAEWIGFFTGLGVVITFLAAGALGRMSVISVRDVQRRRLAEERLAEERTATDRTTTGRTTTGRTTSARTDEERMAEDRVAHDRVDERTARDGRAAR